MHEDLIAVTGATGEVGGRVAVKLAAVGAPLRLIVRDASRAPAIPGAQVATASSYGAADEMRRALEGVRTLFLVSASESPDRVEQHLSAIDAAVAAGVDRVVYTSFVGATPDATFTLARQHHATEERIKESGLRYCIQRQNMYLDFVPTLVGADGVIRGPAGEGRFAPVARDDVADVAVTLINGPSYDGSTFDVTGLDRYTMEDVAEELTRLTGHRVTFHDETVEEAHASREQLGAPAWEVEGWVSSYQAIAAGELDVVSDTVEQLTGHYPQTLAELIATRPSSYAHIGGAVSRR